MRDRAFEPTHLVTVRMVDGGRVTDRIEVMLVDGAAYTRDAWQADAKAAWEYDEQRGWTVFGKTTPSPMFTVEVDALRTYEIAEKVVRDLLPDGEYTRDDLSRQTWPIAWAFESADAKAAERILRAICRDAIALIDETPDAVGVEIRNADVARIVLATGDEP